jgi:hypothetical protein
MMKFSAALLVALLLAAQGCRQDNLVICTWTSQLLPPSALSRLQTLLTCPLSTPLLPIAPCSAARMPLSFADKVEKEKEEPATPTTPIVSSSAKAKAKGTTGASASAGSAADGATRTTVAGALSSVSREPGPRGGRAGPRSCCPLQPLSAVLPQTLPVHPPRHDPPLPYSPIPVRYRQPAPPRPLLPRRQATAAQASVA